MSDLPEKMTRRQMLKRCAVAGAGLGLGLVGLGGEAFEDTNAAHAATLRMREAMFYDKLPGNKIQCKICPKQCVVGDGERGFCGNKENRGGTYYTLVYGAAACVGLDPIEKKPLFHFLPGSKALSVGTAGCNFDCKDCQNWQASQARPEQLPESSVYYWPPTTLAQLAVRYGAEVLAYTYTEPVVFYEYMLDGAVVGHKYGLRSVMISNGYINREPMLKVAAHLDAIKIDLKGFEDDFYRKYCVGSVKPVLETIKRVKALGKWLEIVYLVVPTVNDDVKQVTEACRWLVKAVGPDVPLHFSRFFPQYQLTHLPPTPFETLDRCRKIAREAGLHYVYIGNVEPWRGTENTYCPSCGKLVVGRSGYRVTEMHLNSGKCAYCGHKIAGS